MIRSRTIPLKRKVPTHSIPLDTSLVKITSRPADAVKSDDTKGKAFPKNTFFRSTRTQLSESMSPL